MIKRGLNRTCHMTLLHQVVVERLVQCDKVQMLRALTDHFNGDGL